MLAKFSIADINKLDDGMEVRRINKMLSQIAMDCRNRGRVKKARSVTIQIDMIPVGEDDLAEQIDVDIKTKIKIPSSTSKMVRMDVKPTGALLFNDLSTDNPRQMTIDQDTNEIVDKETGEVIDDRYKFEE